MTQSVEHSTKIFGGFNFEFNAFKNGKINKYQLRIGIDIIKLFLVLKFQALYLS